MKTFAILAIMTTLATASMAADKVAFTPEDTTSSVLTRQAGQKVELVLKSGEHLSGTVKAVGSKAVHLGALTGKEFYDAVIDLEDVSAVIVRNDGK